MSSPGERSGHGNGEREERIGVMQADVTNECQCSAATGAVLAGECQGTAATDVTGAVLVLGGGIAGIQASLDLANSGQKVYLVERSPAIGGNMARLDKTFPTNDCSMCILSPKVVECGRHLNVDLITLGEVTELTGKAGKFTARVRKRARYVDQDACTGCGACLESCPTQCQPRFDTQRDLPVLSAEHTALLDGLVETHGHSQAALLPILQEINEICRYLPQEMVIHVADRLDVPVSEIYRIGTFYTAFSFEPRGEHTISVCTGTACHIKGAPKLIAELNRELGIGVGGTTEDGRFTLEGVRCLGCCALAPVVKIGGRIYGGVKVREIAKILKDY